MDLSMPGIGGLEAIKQIKSMDNPPKVLVVTFNDEIQYFSESAASGADGMLSKNDFVESLNKTIDALFEKNKQEKKNQFVAGNSK
jgi:two-component system, NarL family, invasion response regulator UvrY